VLVNQIKPQLSQLKKFSYGKQILAIEKLIFEGDADPNLSASSQSSTLPSTNASTVEGPVTPPHIQIHQPSPPKDSLNPTSSYFQPHILP
jgi:mRNA-binding protein PUF3